MNFTNIKKDGLTASATATDGSTVRAFVIWGFWVGVGHTSHTVTFCNLLNYGAK